MPVFLKNENNAWHYSKIYQKLCQKSVIFNQKFSKNFKNCFDLHKIVNDVDCRLEID